jgi:GNAT superfamily N-acetyltransferase
MRSAICPTHLHFHDLASHFLALTAGDRFLRFGWVMTDVDIVAYVESLLQSIGNVFVVTEPAPDIAGVLHVDFTSCGADLGLSVAAWARGKGIGTLLLEQAEVLASNRGVNTLFVRNLNFNTALRRLAHHAGMRIACAPGTRSTQLEALDPSEWATGRDPATGTITLADHSLRSQWIQAACGGSAGHDLLQPLPT